MKVLHVIPAVAARYGGPSRAIFQRCRALESYGVRSLVATTDADGPHRLPVELERPIVYEGVPVIFFRRKFTESFKYSPSLARWLKRNVGCFDVVHIDAVFSHSSVAVARVCRQQSVPYLVRPLGSLSHWSLNRKAVRKRFLWRIGVKQMLAGAAAIHYTTQEERRQAESIVGSGCGVIVPLGIDEQILSASAHPEDFRLRYPALGNDPYVLVLCRLHPVKALEMFLDAFLNVTCREEFHHWRLVIAGDGDAAYVSHLKRRVAKLVSNGRVLFTGWLEGNLKAAAIKGADLFALTSYYESFGLSLVEALAYGVAVFISSNVNLANEIESAQAGWIVNLDGESIRSSLI